MKCACAFQTEMCVRIPEREAHAHFKTRYACKLKIKKACAPEKVVAYAHLILLCAVASLLFYAGAYQFGLRMLILILAAGTYDSVPACFALIASTNLRFETQISSLFTCTFQHLRQSLGLSEVWRSAVSGFRA